jgi:hypothetical protein
MWPMEIQSRATGFGGASGVSGRHRGGAQFLRFRREGKKGIDFLFGEQRHEVAIGTGNSVDVLARVESDLRRHDREEQVPARAEIADADPSCPSGH